MGNRGGFETTQEVAEAAKRDAAPVYRELENLGDLAEYEIKNKLKKIKPERYKDVTPQTGLTPQEYADIVQKQADELGINIAKGNPDKINGGIMHFVLDEKTGKTSSRAPFAGTLKDTYTNPDITIKQGNDKNYIGLLNDTTSGKQKIDNLVTRNNELYSKYQIRPSQLAKRIQSSETDNLSISQDILNDIGISPSLEYNNNISRIGELVNSNEVLADTIKRVKRANSSLKNLADTDFKVINEARRALSQASLNKMDISGYEARQALKELDPVLNEIVPQYAEARKIYEGAHQFEQAAEMAQDVFRTNVSAPRFADEVAKLSDKEKQALKLGMRDELYKQ